MPSGSLIFCDILYIWTNMWSLCFVHLQPVHVYSLCLMHVMLYSVVISWIQTRYWYCMLFAACLSLFIKPLMFSQWCPFCDCWLMTINFMRLWEYGWYPLTSWVEGSDMAKFFVLVYSQSSFLMPYAMLFWPSSVDICSLIPYAMLYWPSPVDNCSVVIW
jgi:hypothetical protein